jgi:hypothetical protein
VDIQLQRFLVSRRAGLLQQGVGLSVERGLEAEAPGSERLEDGSLVARRSILQRMLVNRRRDRRAYRGAGRTRILQRMLLSLPRARSILRKMP